MVFEVGITLTATPLLLKKISSWTWVLFFLLRNSALLRASAELFQPAPGQAVPKAESNYESKLWAGWGCKQNFPFSRGKVNSLPCCSQLCSPSCINQGGATGMGESWASFLFICLPFEEFSTFPICDPQWWSQTPNHPCSFQLQLDWRDSPWELLLLTAIPPQPLPLLPGLHLSQGHQRFVTPALCASCACSK